MALDLKLFNIFNSLAGKFYIFDSLIIFLAEYLQYFLISIFLLLILFPWQAKRGKLKIFWVTVVSIVVARLGVTELIRFFYHRPRPFVTHQVHQLISESDWSFPSGHSAFFFAMATAIYLYNKKWGIGFFIAAIFMNISRIIGGVHYPLDILGGAAVGILVAYSVFYLSKRMRF
ncbi:MAG: phosphatase PAP2 family protein [Candidatus Colwellbacteria bacterium]|nr:phosphatase PAP2 family protein [Candidatus Colwellbacteria bacterium]MBI3273664.1 phosphatase PAP2 family protein [Candidatus Colwellbacteria bacterium]